MEQQKNTNKNTEELALTLSEIERKTLLALTKEKKSLQEIAKETNLPLDSVRRSIEWLHSKNLARKEELAKEFLALTEKGIKEKKLGLPERRLLNFLLEKGTATINAIAKETNLTKEEISIALGYLKKNNLITISKEADNVVLSITAVAEQYKDKELPSEHAINHLLGKTLNELSEQEYAIAKDLIKRGLLFENKKKEVFVEVTSLGEEAKQIVKKHKKRLFNIYGEVEELQIGKKQPYLQFLEQVRRKLIALGFKEMPTYLIVQEFYNFDVLFQPQNHPARSWSDTYKLLRPKTGKLPSKNIVNAIKAAHEHGGISASSGWRYSWLEEIAKQLMPAAHGTAHTARQLVKGVEMPAKYFAIARCFRPDVMDASHLIEFNQVEGFVVDENLNFRHLLHLLKLFAKEFADAKKIKFLPDYYPFTEPSVQLSAYHKKLGWIELGGAGMFRPEMLENLNIKGNAIAWGIGIDRLAMFKLGIKDIRYLFSYDIEWLREQPLVK